MEKEHINNGIKHSGIVVSKDGCKVVVSITAESACAGCHVKSVCSASDTKDKIIEADITDGVSMEIGDEVEVVVSQESGYFAVLMSYIVPVILMVASIIIILKVGFSELVGALGSLCIVTVYFFILYQFREKIDKKLVIEVRKKEF
ncbi:MAG: SoxR reducing system RseC family protein [Rikenellaceae bacterium]